MADIEPANPKDDVFGDVRRMVGNTLQMPGGKNVLHSRTDESGLLRHALHKLVEDAVAVLIDYIVTLKDLPGHFHVAKNERSKTFADHAAHGRGHGTQLFRQLRSRHFAEGDDALCEVHGQVPDAFEIV